MPVDPATSTPPHRARWRSLASLLLLPAGPESGTRLRRRLLWALLALTLCELLVRHYQPALDRAFLRGYRLADVALPPLREFAAATARLRRSGALDGRRLVGLAGPSSVWGYGLRPERTLAVRLQQRLDEGGPDFAILNLALPRNRYVDDRLVAGSFAGVVDLVLVPYSAFLAGSLLRDSCPSHLPILEWSSELAADFALPPGCPSPPRHRLNGWLDAAIAEVWHTYPARASLRHLLFPLTQDFGRTLAAPILRSHAVDQRWARQALAGRSFVSPRAALPPSPSLASEQAAMQLEVERLCVAYESRGTSVAFYHLPSVASLPQSGLAEGEAVHLATLEAAIRDVAAHHPGCALWELPLPSPLVAAQDYLDEYHPGDGGLDKLAAALALRLGELPPRRAR